MKGIRFVTPERPDECCGFGGTFSVFEEPVSAKMGYDKVNDHHKAECMFKALARALCNATRPERLHNTRVGRSGFFSWGNRAKTVF